MAEAGSSPSRSISASASPSCFSSFSDKNRSRRRSLNLSTRRQGLEPIGRSPHRSARFIIFDKSARLRFACTGVSLSS